MDSNKFYSQVLQVKDEALLDALVRETKILSLRKGMHLINLGEIVTHVYFLNTGSVRGYFLNKDGNEVTDCFSFCRGDTAMPIGSLDLSATAPLTMEVLEDSSFFCLPISSILRLQEEYFEITLHYNRMLVHALEAHQKLKQVLNQYPMLQRYQWFLEEYPGLVERVNSKHIASFLGMTPITLSRIRKAIRDGIVAPVEEQ